jgi:predicted Zn-dependent protease
VLKYHFVTPMPEEYQEDFDSARDEWMKYAYLEFSETQDPSVSDILITCKDKGGPSSDVGKQQYGPTEMEFRPSSGYNKRAFLHEFGHALGFHHEHQRPGRESSGI